MEGSTDKRIVIAGAGEFGRMAHLYLTREGFNVVGFTAEKEFITDHTWQGLSVYPVEELELVASLTDTIIIMAITSVNRCISKERVFHTIASKGFLMGTYTHPKSFIDPTASIGAGCFIFEHNTIQANVIIENNVTLWSGNHVGHNSRIGAHSFLSSHVALCGGIQVGQRCFFGVNASIAPYLTIGKDCAIGMGTAVFRDVPDGMIIKRGDSRDEMEKARINI